MKLLEHEAKALLREASIPIPKGSVVSRVSDASHLSSPVVLKSQVPVGGRGKLGGVIIANSPEDLPGVIESLLALEIKGHLPSVLLAEEKLQITNEHYLSLLIDRDTSSIRLIAHKNGGIEVEDNDTEDFLNIPIDNESAVTLAKYLGYPTSMIEPLLRKLHDTFIKNDALLVEINPLVYTPAGDLVCGDCKMELDDAAAFRHPEWNFSDKIADTNFVVLNPTGTVATIANGAGLAMSTVDAVAAKGMTPANFLDIGGGADAESILKAFQKIMEFENIQAIVINIFAGITRCDEVAKAIIEATRHLNNLPPLFIRLAGTNFQEAVSLLSARNIPTLATLKACLDAAKEVSRE